MGNKRKGKAVNGKPTKSFDAVVAEQSLKMAQQYIDPIVKEYLVPIHQNIRQQNSFVETLLVRYTVLERLLISKYPDVTEQSLAESFAEVIDSNDGFVKSDSVVTTGDRVRATIKQRKVGEDAFGEPSSHLIDPVDTPECQYPKEIQAAILARNCGDEVSLELGKETPQAVELLITILRVSSPVVKAPAKVVENA